MLDRVFRGVIPVRARSRQDFKTRLSEIIEGLLYLADTSDARYFLLVFDGLRVELYESDSIIMASDLAILPIKISSKDKYKLLYRKKQILYGDGWIDLCDGNELGSMIEDFHYEVSMASGWEGVEDDE